jgi:hypothetical protein
MEQQNRKIVHGIEKLQGLIVSLKFLTSPPARKILAWAVGPHDCPGIDSPGVDGLRAQE